ncbi:hypothetical protein JTB14_018062 [Gonioctena quinquepunctata]|nr:hypothetical protein JTB14_018062 [Gonioctena quinquepunctata]
MIAIPEDNTDQEARVKDVVKIIIPDIEMTGSKIHRLEKPSAGKTRLLKIIMPDSSKHSQLIRKNKKIQAVDRFKNVYIKPHQTVMQRELFIILRQELRERQESGENLVICSTESTCVVQNNEDPLVTIDPHHPGLLIQPPNDSVSYKKFPTIIERTASIERSFVLPALTQELTSRKTAWAVSRPAARSESSGGPIGPTGATALILDAVSSRSVAGKHFLGYSYFPTNDGRLDFCLFEVLFGFVIGRIEVVTDLWNRRMK